jgi:hypothetical protein
MRVHPVPQVFPGRTVLYRFPARNATHTKIASATMKPIDD